jgi:NADPH-dependent FMN reductase
MKKFGLISCSPRENSLSSLGLYHAKRLIEEESNSQCSLFSWRELWGRTSIPDAQMVEAYSQELSLCHGYIWAVPTYCGSVSHHASVFLECFSKCLTSKIHGIILSAGSSYFYLAYKDFGFQLMVETNGIVLPRPCFICENEVIDQIIPLSSYHKIKEMVKTLERYSFISSEGSISAVLQNNL